MPTPQLADFDIFWPLAHDRQMVEGSPLPAFDLFSWPAAGAHYIACNSQVDVFVYLLCHVGERLALALHRSC